MIIKKWKIEQCEYNKYLHYIMKFVCIEALSLMVVQKPRGRRRVGLNDIMKERRVCKNKGWEGDVDGHWWKEALHLQSPTCPFLKLLLL